MWSYKRAAVSAEKADASSVEDAVRELNKSVDDQEKQAIVSTGFLPKATKFAANLPFVRDLLAGYYCMSDGKTPIAIKGAILVPLVYFVVPVDAIPDIIPAAGFTDDLTAWVAAFKMFNSYINEDHYKSADGFLADARN